MGMKIEIPEFEGMAHPDDFIDWLSTVEQIFDLRDIPDHLKSHKVPEIAPVAIIDRQLPFEYTITSRSTDVVVMKNYVELERLGYVLPQELSVGLILNGLTETSITWGRQLVNYMLCSLSKGKANGKVKDKQVYISKPKNPKPSAKEHPAKDDTCHHCKEVGHCKSNCPAYLTELIKKKKQVSTASSSDVFIIELFSFLTKSWVYDTSCGTHICNTKHGLGGVRKLKQVEAIRSFDLVLPNGLVICLDNCHYAPSILRGVVSVYRLVENRFVQCFTDFGKMTRKSFPHRPERATDFLGIIHTDVCGPLRHVSRQGASYFITFTDDYSHRGGEYISQEFKDYLKACGIVQQLTPPYTPQHNGVSERRNHTLLDMVRSMMNLTTLPLSFWDYALESAIRILNMVPTKKVDKTPYELWYEKVPNLSYLKGYPKETMGYYFYFPPENKIVVARYAEFFEKNLITQGVSGRARDLEEIQNEDTSPSEILAKFLWRLKVLNNLKRKIFRFVGLKGHIDAMNAEIQSMMDNMVWVLVDIPSGCKTVGRVDYEETFSPVAEIRAIRILISIAAYYDYEIWQMDIKIAFLNGYLDEDIYMVQPEGFVDPNHPRKVCKLQRSIYGLKQASRSWNKRFDEEIKRFGFAQNLDEPCVYQKASRSNVTFFILYVDDIMIMGDHIPSLQSVKNYLGKCFSMKDIGEAAFILGIKIYRDRSKRLIRLSQNDYMDNILKRYKMDNSKRGTIPMQERLDLNKSQGAQTPEEVNRMKNVPYASAVGSLINTKDMFLVYGGNPKAEPRVDCYCNAGFETDIDDTCTDKTNIKRIPSKTDKHGHGKQKSTKEAKNSKPKPRKVNSQSTMVNLQGRRTRVQGHHIIKQAHWSNPTRRMPRQCEETHKELIFTQNLHSEEAHKCHITDCQAGNPCVHKLDPTANNYDPMIGKSYG
ncbi:retrotransposon protein, putative, ty1-copia subclass [Tanacetum coccineum]